MFSDFLSDAQIHYLRLSEWDKQFSPWSAEWNFEKPEEPICLTWSCVKCGRELLDLTCLTRPQMIGVLEKADLFEKFHMKLVSIPIKGHEPLEVLTCEDCAPSVRKGEDFERIRFVNLCLWLRGYIGMGKDENFLRAGVEQLEAQEVDFPELEIRLEKES